MVGLVVALLIHRVSFEFCFILKRTCVSVMDCSMLIESLERPCMDRLFVEKVLKEHQVSVRIHYHSHPIQ